MSEKYDTNPTELLRELLERVNGLDNKVTALDTKVTNGFADLRRDIKDLSSKYDHAQKEYFDHKIETNERLDNLEQITGSEAPTRPIRS